jgi:hypothetical protein
MPGKVKPVTGGFYAEEIQCWLFCGIMAVGGSRNPDFENGKGLVKTEQPRIFGR